MSLEKGRPTQKKLSRTAQRALISHTFKGKLKARNLLKSVNFRFNFELYNECCEKTKTQFLDSCWSAQNCKSTISRHSLNGRRRRAFQVAPEHLFHADALRNYDCSATCLSLLQLSKTWGSTLTHQIEDIEKKFYCPRCMSWKVEVIQKRKFRPQIDMRIEKHIPGNSINETDCIR